MLLEEPIAPDESAAVRKVKHFYESCVDVRTIENRTETPLLEVSLWTVDTTVLSLLSISLSSSTFNSSTHHLLLSLFLPLMKLLDRDFGGWALIGRQNDKWSAMDWVSEM